VTDKQPKQLDLFREFRLQQQEMNSKSSAHLQEAVKSEETGEKLTDPLDTDKQT
jgi:hypothetical protein